MFLTRISLSDFKNIASADVEFSPKINCISGSNGAGKTNVLDAIYYLSMTKSYFSASDRYVCRFGSDESILCGFYRMDNDVEEKVAASIRIGGEKTFKRGSKRYQRFSEHIGLLPIVMISPADSSLINESGEQRRKYMNFILSQTDKGYLQHIQAYNQLLSQRNVLLKSDSRLGELLQIFSERMEPHAEYVHNARKSLCEALMPMVREFYSKLAPETEEVSITYRSDLNTASLAELLRADAEKERALKYTVSGIQRDDLVFNLDGHPIRDCGSQGQQKSFLLAMKLAQFLFIKKIYNQTPILLLDDVFDKLDMTRVGKLLDIVSSIGFGQIFITDCNKVRLDKVADELGAPCRNFTVEKGIRSEI